MSGPLATTRSHPRRSGLERRGRLLEAEHDAERGVRRGLPEGGPLRARRRAHPVAGLDRHVRRAREGWGETRGARWSKTTSNTVRRPSKQPETLVELTGQCRSTANASQNSAIGPFRVFLISIVDVYR